jgi:hypothetical protein
MRTPKEVVANDSASAAEHARSAAAIRRLAGGMRAQLATDRVMTAKERGILEAAAEVLDRLAQVRGEAAKLAKKHRDDLAARERAIAAALRGALGSLSAAADQIAFIGSVDKHALQDAGARFDEPGALEAAAQEALETLAVVLARQPGGKAPRALAEESVARFKATKLSVQTAHQALIDDITAKREEKPRKPSLR